MKKILAMLLALCMVLALCACGSTSTASTTTETATAAEAAPAEAAAEEAAPATADSITLWTYPIGGWGDEAQVKALTDAFTAETGIAVQVEYLTYTDGDDKVNTAITAGQAPDLIMEGPERLVANWGANGYMVNIVDLFDDDDMAEINASALTACFADDSTAYEYPVVMTAHCMAINYDAFVEAGADQYVDLESHTWTTEDFINAVNALYAYYGDTVGAVYCGGQGGDQGTRAIVNNMYGGTFTNDEHTEYTWTDDANVQALTELYGLDGIAFDPSIVGGDEIALFYNETLKMAFCWNIAQQLNPNSAGTGAGLTLNGQTIEFMSFPSEDGTSKLCGGIWGFGIFDNGDDAKIDAAKQFIKFMGDSEHTVDAVKTANYFAVRSSVDGTDISDIWADNDVMNEYNVLMQYLGDYYQVTTGWANARTQWWNMLQEIGTGADVTETVAKYCDLANNPAA